MYKKKIKKIALLLAAFIFLTGCQASAPKAVEPQKRTNFLLGTIIEITIFEECEDAVFQKAFDRISKIEKKMTINNAQTSEIINLNANGINRPVSISEDTFQVLEKGIYYSTLSNGSFDISIGSMVKLWNIGTDQAAIPDPVEIQKILPLVNYKDIILNKSNLTAQIRQEGMIIDLGAIAKGYAADEVKRVLLENGVSSAIISLGGNILCVGEKPDGSPWRVGVQNPFDLRGEYLGIMEVKDQSVVSSGDYERYFEKDGVRYHHIIDPSTGYPCNNELTSVSIISDISIDGDGLSTTTFLMGLEKGMEFVENLEGIEAVFVTKDKNVYRTSGVKDAFTLTNKEFKIVE